MQKEGLVSKERVLELLKDLESQLDKIEKNLSESVEYAKQLESEKINEKLAAVEKRLQNKPDLKTSKSIVLKNLTLNRARAI